MLTKLIDVCSINKYPQLDASRLEDLRTDAGNVKLLPSSKDYDWVSDREISKDYICDGEVITLGRARYANIKYHKGLFVSANNVIIESKNQNIVLTKFLYYYCLKNSKKFYVEGTTYPKFDMPSFSNSILEVPSISDQEYIIKTFDDIIRLMENEEKQLKLYDELIKSQFIEIFDGKYETKILNEVCEELFAGGDVNKDKSSDKQSEEFPYPIYTNGEKDNGLYGYTSLVRVSKEAVTISGRGTIGFTCLRKEPFYPAVRLIVAVPNQSLVNGCYLQHFIQSKNYGGQGASIPQLTVPMIKNELIPLPPISVQKDFQKFVEQIDKSKYFGGVRYAIC